MELDEIVLYSIALFSVIIIIRAVVNSIRFDKEERTKLEARMHDEFLYDPETGARFTIEQAEEGNWISHENSARIKSSDELENFFEGGKQVVEQISNYLKGQNYERVHFSYDGMEQLAATKILEQYEKCSATSCFVSDSGQYMVFFPEVYISRIGENSDFTGYISRIGQNSDFTGYQIMFWSKLNSTFGHYYLKEKELREKLLGFVLREQDFKIDGFEVFTVRENKNILPVINVLKKFENVKGVEIEIDEDNFYLKTVKEPSFEEFISLESKIKNIC